MTDVLTDRDIAIDGSVSVAAVLAEFPAAVLVGRL